MGQYIATLLHDTIALITIFNPIAAASIMVAMVSPATNNMIRPIALKTTLTLLIASFVTLFAGELIFKLFGISVLSIKVIGGILLMFIAIHMSQGQQSKTRHSKEEAEEAEEKEDISVIPLGIPILFGPGAIATIIVLNNNHGENYSAIMSYGIVALSIIISSLSVYIILRYAGAINKALGVTGMKILTRIMGLVVGAIAAQFLVGGIKGLWATI